MFESHSPRLGDVQTVTGTVKSSELGVVLPYEHLLSDTSAYISPPVEASAREIYFSPINDQVLSYVRYYGLTNQNVLRMGSIETVVNELLLFKQWGGGTIVDSTSAYMGRDPVGLARLSRAADIKIIMSTSCESAIRDEGDDGTIRYEDLVATMVAEIQQGARGHGTRAGLIIFDESHPYSVTHGDEMTPLRACVAAHKVTGAPLMVRPTRDENKVRWVVDQLAELDVAAEHLIFGRMGGRTSEELRLAAEAGFLLSFDSFGSFGAAEPGTTMGPYQQQTQMAVNATGDGNPGFEAILELISDGYEGQILLSQGIGSGDRLVRYGGHGYFYVSACVVPSLRAHGVPSETLNRLISENPQKALAFC